MLEASRVIGAGTVRTEDAQQMRSCRRECRVLGVATDPGGKDDGGACSQRPERVDRGRDLLRRSTNQREIRRLR